MGGLKKMNNRLVVPVLFVTFVDNKGFNDSFFQTEEEGGTAGGRGENPSMKNCLNLPENKRIKRM